MKIHQYLSSASAVGSERDGGRSDIGHCLSQQDLE
jgi:hypothetical protein